MGINTIRFMLFYAFTIVAISSISLLATAKESSWWKWGASEEEPVTVTSCLDDIPVEDLSKFKFNLTVDAKVAEDLSDEEEAKRKKVLAEEEEIFWTTIHDHHFEILHIDVKALDGSYFFGEEPYLFVIKLTDKPDWYNGDSSDSALWLDWSDSALWLLRSLETLDAVKLECAKSE